MSSDARPPPWCAAPRSRPEIGLRAAFSRSVWGRRRGAPCRLLARCHARWVFVFFMKTTTLSFIGVGNPSILSSEYPELLRQLSAYLSLPRSFQGRGARGCFCPSHPPSSAGDGDLQPTPRLVVLRRINDSPLQILKEVLFLFLSHSHVATLKFMFDSCPLESIFRVCFPC